MEKIIISEKKTLLLLFAVAVFIRIFFIFAYDNQKFLHNVYFANDEKTYVSMAESISLGQKAEAKSTSLGYPIFLAGIFMLFGKNLVVIRIIEAFLGGVTCVFIYCLAKQIFNRRLGILSALILAVDPFHIYQTGYVMTEIPFVFLLTGAFFFIYRGVFFGRINIFILGNILLASAGFCRISLFALYPFVFIWLIFIFWNSRKQMFKYLSLFLISSFFFIFIGKSVISGLYLSRPEDASIRKVNLFDWVLTYTANSFVINSYQSHLGMAYPEHYAAWRANLFSSGEDSFDLGTNKKIADAFYIYAKEHPQIIFKIIYQRFINFWRIYPNRSEAGKADSEFSGLKFKIISILSYGLILPFFILGLVLLVKKWREMFLFYALIFVFVYMHTIIQSAQIRYRIQIAPAFIIFSSFGLIRAVQFVNRRINLCK